MTTTVRTFVDGLIDLSVTGVKRDYEHPPKSLAVADLPAKWVRLPEMNDGAFTFSGEGGWPEHTAEMWIAIEPTELGTQLQNFDDTITIIDNLNTALRAVTAGTICKSKLEWTMISDVRQIGQALYWVIITRITGNG